MEDCAGEAGAGLVKGVACRLAAGEALTSICRDRSMPDLDVITALMAQDEAVRALMARARAVRAEVLADDALDIVEQVAGVELGREEESVNRSRDGDGAGTGRGPAPVADKDALALAKLRIDVRKWLIGRAEAEASAVARAAGRSDDRATLAVEALREFLCALDGQGRGLPAVAGAGPPPVNLDEDGGSAGGAQAPLPADLFLRTGMKRGQDVGKAAEGECRRRDG